MMKNNKWFIQVKINYKFFFSFSFGCDHIFISNEKSRWMDIYFLFLSLDKDVIQFVSLIRLTNRNYWWIISLSSYFTLKQKQTPNILHLFFHLTMMSSSKNKIVKFNQKVERSVNFDSFIIDDSFCFQKQFTKICRLLIEIP
jgi:hypothetical protein